MRHPVLRSPSRPHSPAMPSMPSIPRISSLRSPKGVFVVDCTRRPAAQNCTNLHVNQKASSALTPLTTREGRCSSRCWKQRRERIFQILDRGQDDHTRWRRMLDEWLSRKPTVARFRVLASAILEHGAREDIDLLSKHAISGDSDEVDRLRASARFGVMRRSLH